MNLTRAKANVARTAHLTAWARALGRLPAGDVANGDYLAERALLPYQAALIRVSNCVIQAILATCGVTSQTHAPISTP